MKKPLSLLVLAPLALASCNFFNTPKPETGVSGTVVESKVTADATGNYTLPTTAWTGGAGKIVLSTFVSGSPKALTETALSAQGGFALTSLPVPTSLTKYSANTTAGCTDTTVISDKEAQIGDGQFTVDATKDGPVALMSVTGKTMSAGSLSYADRNFTWKGRVECKDPAGKVTSVYDVDVRLVKGWNWVNYSGTPATASTPATATLRSGVPAGAQWIYLNAGAASLSISSLF
ncbi:hypothetical protein [Deinococcus arcticus]|uniref:Lipoprotein n=1 Tax=Deinococcus arcticus TaxID=2136176 RepID=A0A2T3W6Z3_9DEIO|nr:hypothetical protein [Deinococcus arcticus]PTA67668.1 hypothetical protein C8263_11175 [Deinococcus arcticus]